MAKIEFSKEQLLAINERNKNIIVSAGAGSGKTAVLTERIKQILLSGVKANELLVLTFTNAAAAEMKERIIQTMAEDETLKQRTAEVDGAYITTFDSYSLSLVKKYHDRLNLTQNLTIIENGVINVYKRSIINEIFENKFENLTEGFKTLLTDLTHKSDSYLKKQILAIANKIDLRTDRDAFLDNFVNNNFSKETFEKYLNDFTSILLNKIAIISNCYDKLTELFEKQEHKDKLKVAFGRLLNAKTYNEIIKSFPESKPTYKNLKDDTLSTKEKLYDTYDSIKKLCTFEDEQHIEESFFQSKVYVEEIIDILKQYFKKLDAYKLNHEAFEFIDISKMAINLVKNNKDIKEEITKGFYEILVDEYQDTNDTQEEFISYICKNNVYMVGDIKQSIYGFRNANPMIFKNKYDLYRDSKTDLKIDLTNNFRSNKEVLYLINLIFNQIMDDQIGQADYKKEHQMQYGLKAYDKLPGKNKIKVISYEKQPKDSKIKHKDIDMFYIAKNIKEKIEAKEMVYDKDLKDFRECTYKDFAILVADSVLFNSINRLLDYNHIPSMIYKNVDVNSGVIVSIIKNILKLIAYDYKKNHNEVFLKCFYGVGRSFIVQYSDEQLFDYITNKTYKESPLYALIQKYSNKLLSTTLSDIVKEIIEDFDIYQKIIEIGDVDDNITRVEYVLKTVSSMDKLELTLFEFVEYLDDMFENDEKLEFKSAEDDENKVKIMTIHKSKGLEYPIVYFINNDKKFNKADTKDKIVYHPNYGIISSYFIGGEDRTVNYKLMKNEVDLNTISEKLRLLYVALTRAREQIIILHPKQDSDADSPFTNDEIVSNTKREAYNSFTSIYSSVLNSLSSYVEEINIEDLNINKDYLLSKQANVKDLIIPNSKKIELINNNITVVEKTNKHASKENKKLISKESLKNMEHGTLVHEIFENVDFTNPDYECYSIREQKMIKEFLSLDILKNIKNGKIYKEFEFIDEIENTQIHGIIDLMIEYDSYVDIIDYKLSNTDDEAYIIQLNTYRKYIEKKTNKPVNLYLYSIMKQSLTKIEGVTI